MEIFSRLPPKSIGRCRCVSKPWASILRGSDFTELFLTRSLACPQLLFIGQAYGELHFFSSPQPQNIDENSPHIVANSHMNFSDVCYFRTYRPVHGLVCLMQISKAKEETPLIYNPSTGQSLLLPKLKTRWVGAHVFSLLGYDPIDKQFKLLAMTRSGGYVDNVHEEHQVLTLGSENHSWRMIKCCKPYYPWHEGICIDGVLYYTALEKISSEDLIVVCFDVSSEKFRFIQVTQTFNRYSNSTLINYNGKLGLLGFGVSSWANGSSKSIELIILENDLKNEWSKHTYVLPTLWKNMVGNDTPYLGFIGMTRTNEILLATCGQSVPFYVLYYNIKRETITRLQIRGMEAFENKRVHVFLNHVENLKLM